MTLSTQDRKQYDCNHKWEYVGSGLSRCHKCEAQGFRPPKRCKWCGQPNRLHVGRIRNVWGHYCRECLIATVV